MEEFWFYIKLGLNHVLDFGAYDHILFLAALTIPFSFNSWKKIVLLATVFTIAHCVSLALSVYDMIAIDAGFIELLIPITIILTAMFNIYYLKQNTNTKNIPWHLTATAFFGIIHGFGFSNYFKMLMAEEEQKLRPLLGFATGIEISQVLIMICILGWAYLVQSKLKVKHRIFVTVASLIIVVITVPMLLEKI